MQVSEFRAAVDRGRREFPWVDLEECNVRGGRWRGCRCAKPSSIAPISARPTAQKCPYRRNVPTEMSLLKVSAIASQWVAARLDHANCQKANFHQANFVGAQLTATQWLNNAFYG